MERRAFLKGSLFTALMAMCGFTLGPLMPTNPEPRFLSHPILGHYGGTPNTILVSYKTYEDLMKLIKEST